ncbi:hypothetical protein B8T70_15025 [Flavobacterium sp. AJR]|nr:hypothetical protein B8T70_15025 [Flavobacterium sp. AJR]
MFFISCEKKNNELSFKGHEYISMAEIKKKSPPLRLLDSLKKKYMDTVDREDIPVKILSAKLLKNEYSNFRDIHLVFKNISKKDVQAVKIQWFSVNSLEEPSNLRYFFVRGESCGLSVKLLKRSMVSKVTFEEFSSDANRVIKARAYEVIFSDGTVWSLKNQEYLDAYLIKSY